MRTNSSICVRIAFSLGRPLFEVPVGFEWFVDPLLSKRCALAGEESVGASFLTRACEAWTTDKGGILLTLLAIEMTSRAGRDLADARYRWTKRLGDPRYARIDVAASDEMRKRLSGVTDADVSFTDPDHFDADTLRSVIQGGVSTNFPMMGPALDG